MWVNLLKVASVVVKVVAHDRCEGGGGGFVRGRRPLRTPLGRPGEPVNWMNKIK